MQKNASPKAKVLRNALVFIVMIALGIGGYMYFMNNKPTVAKKKKTKQITTVDVMHLTKGDVTMNITGTGTVIPARQIDLKSEITGTIAWISPKFAEGGIIRKGEEILRVDPRDYELELRKCQGSLASAEAALMIEKGQQRVAQEGARLLADGNTKQYSTSLALRKPQMMQAEATLAQAQAEVEKAKLDISRCTIRAPFDVLVQSTSVNLGSHITSSTQLATLVGTKEYWVETAVPLDQLEYIGFSRNNITAKIVRQGGVTQWEGKVVRLKGTLTESTRLARVIVAVSDPQKLNSEGFNIPLMLGDYVDVTINGNTLTSAYKIPRAAVRNNNELWAYEDGKLTIIPLTVLWQTSDYVYAEDSLGENRAIITSHLSNPYSGMAVSVTGSAVASPEKKKDKKSDKSSDSSAQKRNQVASAE